MAIRPPILRAGDTVGVVTLGSPLSADTINARIATLRSMGFNVITGRYTYQSEAYLSGTPQQRASDLMSMFVNPAVSAIIPARGGVGVSSIIQYLDYPTIYRNPKIITGYSDVTILLNILYQWANLITFHSLLLIDFAPTTPDYNYNEFFTATSTLTSPRIMQNPPGIPMISWVPGIATGPIVGGNLTSFTGSLGTAFEIDTRGKILFIEEVHEPINTVYRYMEQLAQAGKFDDCIGIIVGECTDCLTAYGETFEGLIWRMLVPLGKPLMTNLATGHGVYKMAIPLGANATLNTWTNTLTINEPTVSL